jgi:hypothetical protein
MAKKIYFDCTRLIVYEKLFPGAVKEGFFILPLPMSLVLSVDMADTLSC